MKLDDPTHELLVHVFAFVPLPLHVFDEGFILLLIYFMFPKLLEGLHKLWVKGSFGVILFLVSTVICLE